MDLIDSWKVYLIIVCHYIKKMLWVGSFQLQPKGKTLKLFFK